MTGQQLDRLRYLVIDDVLFPATNATKEELERWIRDNGERLQEARQFIIELLFEKQEVKTIG